MQDASLAEFVAQTLFCVLERFDELTVWELVVYASDDFGVSDRQDPGSVEDTGMA
jgi:hypothetical protein